MSWFRRIVLYTALSLSANAAGAQTAELMALREGTMEKLIFAETPETVPDVAFKSAEGAELKLSDFRGRYVLLNFWATWCAPCKKEMPALDRLQADFGGDRFEVLTVATGRNSLAGIARFFREGKIENLPMMTDLSSELAQAMSVLGLPITVLIDPEGREIARLQGDAEWDGESARAIFSALLEEG